MKGHKSRQQIPSNNPRGSPHHGQPPSSGRSSSSGRYLPKHPHVVGDGLNSLGRCRSASSLRTTEGEEKIRVAGKRKTRLVVILGITLPVIACILGIVAWAVTTDLLRITPRSVEDDDDSLEQFERQNEGKDALQPRIDPATTVFQFRETTKKAHLPTLTFVKTTMRSRTTKPTPRKAQTTTTQATSTTRTTTTSSKPVEKILSTTTADLFSKLLSTKSSNRTPEFVVFAPILDDSHASVNNTQIKKSFLKTIIDHSSDLVAAESIVSEEHPQGFTSKSNVIKKHRSKAEGRRLKNFPTQKISFKLEDKMHIKNPPNMRGMNSNPPRPSQFDYSRNDNTKYDIGGSVGKKMFDQSNLPINLPENLMQSNRNSQRRRKNFNQKDSKHNENPSHLLSSSQEYQPASSVQFPDHKSSQLQLYPEFQQSSSQHSYEGQQQSYEGQQQSYEGQQQSYEGQQQSYEGQQQSMSHQSFQDSPVDSQFSSQSFKMNRKRPHQHQQQNYDMPPQSSFQQNSHTHSFSPQFDGPPPSYNTGLNSHQQSYQNKPTSGNSFQRQSQSFQTKSMANEDPQYFAPPPQTFHTRTSYAGSMGQSQSSMDNYDNIGQVSVSGMDNGGGTHHRHHHHLNLDHDQHDTFSDLSNSPLTNDADRLGSLGISSGTSGSSPRGITLQIGGGPVGLTGLLPIGALGIARGILRSLLPRPALGLNGRVFVGLEVGKGRGILG